MKFIAGVIGVLMFLTLAVGCQLTLRNHEIDKCRDNGGQAITAPWYSEKFYEVRCVK